MSERTFSADLPGTLAWLQYEASRRDYAEITVTLKVHNGSVSHIERAIVEKLKPTGGPGGAYGERKR